MAISQTPSRIIKGHQASFLHIAGEDHHAVFGGRHAASAVEGEPDVDFGYTNGSFCGINAREPTHPIISFQCEKNPDESIRASDYFLHAGHRLFHADRKWFSDGIE